MGIADVATTSSKFANGQWSVLVVHPKVRWGSGSASVLKQADRQLEEAVALVNNLPNMIAVDSLIMPVDYNTKRKSIGATGNLEKLVARRETARATALMVNVDVLSPAQQEELFGIFEVPIFDRYNIVLSTFKEFARTDEARLQISLAEIPYIKHRIHALASKRLNSRPEILHVEQQCAEIEGGDLNEILRKRGQDLRRNLKEATRRATEQQSGGSKHSSDAAVIAVVGYTNAGKTSLVKRLTGAESLKPKDQLFATLDTTRHVAKLPSGRSTVFTDTIGFLSDLPIHLIAAFEATLAHVKSAVNMIHVLLLLLLFPSTINTVTQDDASHYELLPKSIQHDAAVWSAVLRNSQNMMMLNVVGMTNSTMRIQIDNSETAIRKRYIKRTSSLTLPEELAFESVENGQQEAEIVGGNKKLKVVVTYKPFLVNVINEYDELVLQVNKYQKLKIEEFKSFIDRKQYGSNSVGVDIAFVNFKTAYGLPEHADAFALRNTVGNTDPYQLYNYAEYTSVLYGFNYPYFMAHFNDRAAGFLWYNSLKTVFSSYNGNRTCQHDSKKNAKNWSEDSVCSLVSEDGRADILLFLGPLRSLPKSHTRVGAILNDKYFLEFYAKSNLEKAVPIMTLEQQIRKLNQPEDARTQIDCLETPLVKYFIDKEYRRRSDYDVRKAKRELKKAEKHKNPLRRRLQEASEDFEMKANRVMTEKEKEKLEKIEARRKEKNAIRKQKFWRKRRGN
ncbi:hypothetical protein CRE_22870 [Caenorhabditis remanei]|uniref:Hflx-type G domain-containing protein n=1 Tax=Caenorhabditis remanei TaxID=31234 RepID=E3MHM7_CAERE|nr:hypothetical protein CRE_22870 [Caenorhabditis remanei]